MPEAEERSNQMVVIARLKEGTDAQARELIVSASFSHWAARLEGTPKLAHESYSGKRRIKRIRPISFRDSLGLYNATSVKRTSGHNLDVAEMRFVNGATAVARNSRCRS